MRIRSCSKHNARVEIFNSRDSKTYKTFVLVLGRSAPHLELRFRILSTPIAKKWSQLLAASLCGGGIKERERFVNFSPDSKIEHENLVNSIKEISKRLSIIHPEIDFGSIDFSDTQKEVNRLHVNFADRHLVYHDLTSSSFKDWEAFNYKLHQLESVARRATIEKASGIKNALLNVTYCNSPSIKLSVDDFKEGVLYRTFGVCYVAYSQVGRHISELFYSNDFDVPDAHIQPFDTMRADMRIWFGHNQSQTAAREFLGKIRKWFSEEWREKFEKLGLVWDCNALGIPEIPVAVLEEPIFTDERIIAMQDEIFRQSYVHDVVILED